MKKLFLSATILIVGTFVSAQELPVNEETGKVTFMSVEEMGNVKAKEAYDVIKEWANGKTLRITEDEAGSKIYFEGKHNVSYPAVKGGISNDGIVIFTLQFFFKDGKYRYITTDFVHSGKYGNGGKLENEKPQDGYGKVSERAWNMIRNQTYEKTTSLVTSFTKAITEFQNDPARSDDW